MDEPTEKWMDRQMKWWTYDRQTGEWMVWEIGGGTEKRGREREEEEEMVKENICSQGQALFWALNPIFSHLLKYCSPTSEPTFCIFSTPDPSQTSHVTLDKLPSLSEIDFFPTIERREP